MNHGLKICAAVLFTSLAAAACAQKISRVSLAVPEVTGGVGTTATVEISAKAPAAGLTVTLAATNPAVTVPATIAIPSGQTSATFPVSTVAVPANLNVQIKGTAGAATESASLRVFAPQVAEFSFIPALIQGGSGSTASVKLTSPAPTGGIKVHFASSTPAWGGPEFITVSAGDTIGSFSFTSKPVGFKADATVNAFCTTARVPSILTLTPPLLTGFTLTPTSVVGGISSTGILKLNGPAPSEGVRITLSSDSPLARVPDEVMIHGGETTGQFEIKTKSVSEQVSARIVARAPASSIELALVVALPKIATFTSPSGEVVAGKSTTAVINLNGPAPAGGLTITLECSNSAVKIPATLSIPAGSSSLSFVINTNAVTQGQTAVINATAPGGKAQQITLHISKPA